MSIRHRIYLSAALFAALFIINRIVAFSIINKTKKASANIVEVIDPSLDELNDFRNVIAQSRTDITNWVFLPGSKGDNPSLLKIHQEYLSVKANLLHLSKKWSAEGNVTDSLHLAFHKFETLETNQKAIIALLDKAGDNITANKKIQAEKILEDSILQQTASLISTVNFITLKQRSLEVSEENFLNQSLTKIWRVMIFLAIAVLCGVFIFSKYLGDFIVKPVNQLRNIVDDLNHGLTNKIERNNRQDEIGEMVTSVNNLSDRLKHAASFAQNVGERKFDVSFYPLSDDDTLGKALLTMRNNLKFVDESLNEAQGLAKMGNWRWDLETNKVFWSDELYNIFEKNPANFIPSFETSATCIHADDREFIVTRIQQFLIDQQSFSHECRIVNEKGDVKQILVQARIFVDENGKALKMSGIVQDITKQVEKEIELKQTTERFHNLSKATEDSIWDWNLVTDEVWWNENFYQVFDYDPAKGTPSIGDWIMKMHPDDRTKVVSNLKQIKQRKTDAWRDEFRYFKKDGTIGIAFSKSYTIRDHKGKPVRVVGSIHDITDRRRALRQLADSERKYRQIVETAQEGIWLIDEHERTVFVNQKMCELLEYPQEQIIGKENYFFKEESEKANALKLIERRKKGISEQYETSYLTRTGRRLWVSVSANPIFDDKGQYKGALGMLTDISQRKLQENLLKESEANLEAINRELNQKNTELEQFAYIASHDLQEPLRTVNSFADRLHTQYQDEFDEIGKKYLYFIQQGTERMKTLITDLLDYSRIGRGRQLKPVDCNEILNTVIADLDTAIHESEVEIRTDKLPVVNGYTTEMKQLFQNLLVNAIKFRKKEVCPRIYVSSQPIDGGWEFKVQDNGIGIDEQHNERIFAIFQRLHTRSEYEGSGIGLSHCKKIVELHGGKIWVKSKPGEGSIFHFTIFENQN